jgi:NAD(P)-dependent dehydrogenase (short-subunit alcohol dehydrogenase family)
LKIWEVNVNLDGKVALVTGGATRVGRAISLALARGGADVVVNYNSSVDEALRTQADIVALGRTALPFKADVSHSDQVQAMVEASIAQFGRLDVLVNSASIWRRTPWPETSEADWDLLLGVAAKGPFLCARAAAPHLTAHGDGAIVNIVDLSAFVPFPNYLPHSAAKAALLNMTYALAIEMAPAVRVNAVAPGPVLPPPDFTPEQAAVSARATLLGRWGTAEDVAQAVVFLVEAGYVTGVVLPVDGGELLAWRKRRAHE